MTALDAAIALAQGDAVAEAVREHLEFHVARAQHELLQIDIVVGESRGGLGLRRLVFLLQVLGAMHFAHALAASAGAGLDEHGIAHALRELASLQGGVDGAVAAGHGGNAAALHGVARDALVAHGLDAIGRGADPDYIVVLADAGELRVLGQKPVARVDGLGAGVLRGGDDAGHHQVALVGGSGPDAHRLIGIVHGQRVLVLGGEHRDGLHAELFGRAHDAQGDFAAIGDKDLVEHQAFSGLSDSGLCGSR